jgi:monoamine oxidase
MKASPLCKAALREQLVTDNGIPADRQSYLGVLAMIKGGGLRHFWDDTEVFRCKGGNQQLAHCLAQTLPKGSILLNRTVKQILLYGDRVEVVLKKE